MQLSAQFAELIRACFTGLWIESHEHADALTEIAGLCRDENWQLMATKLQLHDAFFGRRTSPAGEIWLRDSDVVIVPKSRIQWTGDLIELFFTRGLYGVVPVFGSFELRHLSIL